jgi:acylphosphatase
MLLNSKVKAYKIRVFGRVQRVGYRRYTLDLAQELNLSGYSKNLPDGSLEVLIQGEENKINKFIEEMKNPPPPVKIIEFKVEEVNFNPAIKEFKIIYGKIAEELQEGFGAMQAIFMDYWKEFRDYRQEFREYRQEFRDFRNEFRDYRQEFKDFRNEFREFAKRTDENFRILFEQNNEILKKLTTILEILVKETNETRLMLNESLRLIKEVLEKIKA